jgi:acyl-CoA thioesterase YciA
MELSDAMDGSRPMLISTHVCKGQNIGVHGNLFGGVMLSWLDEAGAAFSAQVCGSPRMVTKCISQVVFQRPVRPGQIIKIYGDVVKIGSTSITLKLMAKRHNVVNGSQKSVCDVEMTFVRIDDHGDSVPILNIKKGYENKRVKKTIS